MEAQTYLKELSRYLAQIDKTKRNEIIEEINSYINETNASYAELITRFGEPKTLAAEYLEDIPTKLAVKKIVYRGVKFIFTGVGMITVLVIMVLAYYAYKYTQTFDYAKYNANTINTAVDNWTTIDLKKDTKITISQARVGLYSHDKEYLQYNCVNSDEENVGAIYNEKDLVISKATCFIKLPKDVTNIKTHQAQVAMVRLPNKLNINASQSKILLIAPLGGLNLNLNQAELIINEEQHKYTYDINATQADFSEFVSKTDGIPIKIKAHQAKGGY